MKNKLKEMKGITLIALVITIIVLLILAGVSIATLTGENGILTQATNAKNKTKEAEADEIFKLIANEWQIEKAKGTSLSSFLEAKKEEYGITVTEDEDGYIIEYNEEKIKIDVNGTLTEVSEEGAVALASGLYAEDGSLTKTWQQLIDDGDLVVTDGVLYGGNICNGWDGECASGYTFAGEGKLVVDSSVTYIGGSAFGCDICSTASYGLTSIIIPDSVEGIGSFSFYNCCYLKYAQLPEKFDKGIGLQAFQYCTSLDSIAIPEGVETLGLNAFYGCSSLKSVNLPLSFSSWYHAVFENCTSLTTINYSGTVEQWGNIVTGYDDMGWCLYKWHDGCPEITVHCTDGDVTIEED